MIKHRRYSVRLTPLPPDSELLLEASRLFEYNSDGSLIYKVDPRHPNCLNSKVIGKVAGGNDGSGYLSVRMLGHDIKAHHVVWLMHNGAMPTLPIDHINRNRRDNRIENLRLATDQQNQANLKASVRKYAGVEKPKNRNFYVAKITVNGKKKYLGAFKTPEEANAEYRRAKRVLAKDFSPV